MRGNFILVFLPYSQNQKDFLTDIFLLNPGSVVVINGRMLSVELHIEFY